MIRSRGAIMGPWWIAFALLGCIVVGCATPDAPPAESQSSTATTASRDARATWDPQPSLILISIDTLRSDRLPIYGYDGVETPAIDALRAESILFERAYSHVPLTLPSHVSILSGRLPNEHGIRDNAGYRFDAEAHPYLPVLLGAAGYNTAATVSSYSLDRRAGIDVGFDLYDDRMEETGSVDLWGTERLGPSTLKVAVDWLDQTLSSDGETPFFLFFHIFEPHLPYTPPEPFRSRWGETYEAEIAAADAVVGNLIDALRERGVWDDAAVILVSDHGEGLMDHGEYGHGILIYREAIQVPLLLKLPRGERGGASSSVPVPVIDVFATLTEFAGVDSPPTRSRSLLDSLEPDTDEREIYSETFYPLLNYGWSELRSLIVGPWQYIEAPTPELYDLLADPAQTDNVLSAERRTYARLRDQLGAYDVALEAPADVDEETRAKLEALGYLSGGGAVAQDDGPLPDPKDVLSGIWRRMEEGYGHYRAGRYAEAVPVFRSLVADQPELTDAWVHLGTSLRRLGRLDEALEAYQRGLELSRGEGPVALLIARVLMELGRFDEAASHVELALEASPGPAGELLAELDLARGQPARAKDRLENLRADGASTIGAERLLGMAWLQLGELEAAIDILEPLAREHPRAVVLNALALAYFEAGRNRDAAMAAERVLATQPDNAAALETAGLAALAEDDLGTARDRLEAAVQHDPRRSNAWNLLGVVRFRVGDAEGALDAWEQAARDPRQLDALFNLGLTAARMGETERARGALERYVATAPPGPDVAQARALLERLESSP
ncbi:MAG: sulfatase-like hydrolase/transferase [Acidobacteriota bacterium]